MKKRRIGQSPLPRSASEGKKKINSRSEHHSRKELFSEPWTNLGESPEHLLGFFLKKISSALLYTPPTHIHTSTAPHTSIQRGSTREFCTSWETRNRRWERVVRVWAAMCSPRASSIPVMLMHPMTRGDPNIVECFFHANSARAKGLAAAIPQRWGCRLRHPCQLNIPSIQTSQTIVSKTRTRWARKFNAYRYSLRRSRKGGRPWHVQRHAIQENSTPSNTS